MPSRSIYIGLVLLLLSGCDSARRVTFDPAYKTDLRVGAVYVLLKPVLVVHYYEAHAFWGFSRSMSLDPADFKFYDEHKNESTAYEGILAAGTRVQFLFLGYSKTPMVEGGVAAYGQIIDGRFANAKFKMSDITKVSGNDVTIDPSALREE